MKNFAYIPTKSDRAQIERLFIEPTEKKDQPDSQERPAAIESNNPDKKLNQKQLKALVTRLTKLTKKEYEITQQSTHILHNNRELKEKRKAGQKVENRLLAKGKEKEKKIESMGQQLEQQQRQKWFREVPEISQKGRKINHKTIDRRLNDLISARHNKKQQLKDKYEPVFQPIIDPHSEFINDVENLGDLFNRMKVKEKDAEQKKKKTIKAIKEEEKEQLTFKPVINQKSRQIAQSLPSKPIQQASFDKECPKEECYMPSFVPEINKNTDRLLKNRDKSEDCFRRLFNQARYSTDKNQQKRQEIERNRVFHPSLNTKSLKMANSRKKKEKIACQNATVSVIDDNEDFFEVKIGNGSEASRARTCSLRGSKVTRGTWVQQSENMSPWDIKSCLKKRLKMI